MRWRIAVAALVAVAGSAFPASAHEGGAARVTLNLLKNGTYRLDARLAPEHLPPGTTTGSPAALSAVFVDGLVLEFDGVRDIPRLAPGGGRTPDRFLVLHFEGRIPAGAGAVVFREEAPLGEILVEVRNEGFETADRRWSRAGWSTGPFSIASPLPRPTVMATIRAYLALGFRHIVPDGLDHILFVLGLFLASRTARSLLVQVTAFTLAHSITLGLAMAGVVSLPPSIVEPAIAISIVFVAIENVVTTEIGRARVVAVFAFGLLHGLGFAGALRELGLPRSRFLPALVAFNLGVEAGQLSVLAVAFLAVGVWFRRREWYRARIVIPVSLAIAAIGAYWTIVRLFGR